MKYEIFWGCSFEQPFLFVTLFTNLNSYDKITLK